MIVLARSFALATMVTFSSVAVAELECGYLIGTRQTAIRLAQAGWPYPDVLRQSLDQPNYRSITREERELVIRVVQEAYTSPPNATSQIVLPFCQAEIERKNAARKGEGATQGSNSPSTPPSTPK
jgi:hypothetical protein